jgi:hypothetical protein
VLAPRIAARRDEAAAAGDAAGAAEWAAALRVTCIKLCVGGGGVGVAAALVFWLCEGAVQSAFLGGDDAAVAYLHTWLWPMLCFSQVLNYSDGTDGFDRELHGVLLAQLVLVLAALLKHHARAERNG